MEIIDRRDRDRRDRDRGDRDRGDYRHRRSYSPHRGDHRRSGSPGDRYSGITALEMIRDGGISPRRSPEYDQFQVVMFYIKICLIYKETDALELNKFF